MPCYDLICKKCGPFELRLSFAEFDGYAGKFVCPTCQKRAKLALTEPPHSHVVNSNTVGAQAEKNSRKFGKNRIEEVAKPLYKPKGDDPWYGVMDKKKQKQLANASPADRKRLTQKYIREGT